ncbi:hypothetical protein ACJRO7_035995 [Eucalyptus globulus]|uniref:Formin-like protein 18 n=1 Tax=Eucalyptus globulus TaxID=34317 RepID=A0ABD3JJJ6_EUCGL
MDPCPFLRILVGNLSLKLPQPSFSSSSSSAAPSSSSSSSSSFSTTVHPSSSSFFCKVKLANLPPQHASLPLTSPPDRSPEPHPSSQPLAACFSLPKPLLEKLALQNPTLRIEVHRGRFGGACGLVGGSKLIGKVSVPLDLRRAEARAASVHSGWVDIGRKSGEKLYVSVRAEPDPRFVFEFEKEPECSPQVFQVQGSVKQPVFTCNFSFRNNVGDRSLRSRSSLSETSTSRSWIPSLVGSDKDSHAKERKGWSVTIHDLSGSPVAAASMVTPFVPSPGSDRVSRSNPGAWLILRPEHGTWRPWGRLEAWLEHGSSDMLSHRFELLPNTTTATTGTVANSSISIKNGGKFTIDLTNSVSPMSSPSSSMDLGGGSWSGSGSGSDFVGLGLWPNSVPGGFVMSSTMQGVNKASKPQVEVGVQHVTCTEDAAAFVALAAAIDLSMDACKLFSRKLRTELRQQSQECAI